MVLMRDTFLMMHVCLSNIVLGPTLISNRCPGQVLISAGPQPGPQQVGLTRLPVSDSCEAVSGASSPLLHTAGMMLLLPAVWSFLKHWPNRCSPQTLSVMLTCELSNTAADQRAFILQLKQRAANSPRPQTQGWVNVTFHGVLSQDLQTTGARSSSAAVLFTGLQWAWKPQQLIYCRINAESPPQLFSTRERSSGI